MKKAKLPKVLYVRMEREGDAVYPIAGEFLVDLNFDDDTEVGIYQLHSIKRGRIKTTLE